MRIDRQRCFSGILKDDGHAFLRATKCRIELHYFTADEELRRRCRCNAEAETKSEGAEIKTVFHNVWKIFDPKFRFSFTESEKYSDPERIMR